MTEEDTFEALQLRVEIDKNGTKRYYNHENQLHREYGPAVIYTSGTKMWYINGKQHREDGPAVERANGNRVWRLNGKLHRMDGPAIEYASGIKEWWVNGKNLTQNEFLKHPLCTIK